MDRTFRIEELLEDAGWLRRLAAGLVGDTLADDLVQDTWVAALRRPPRGGAEGHARRWLRTVLANRARNAGRDRARREARELDAHAGPAASGGARPDEIAHAAEAQRLLADAVARLDEPLRAVVVLRYFQGLESPEVGTRLGISGSAVRTRLQRALDALRADLDGRVAGGRASWAALLLPLAERGDAAATLGSSSAGAGTAGGLLGGPALAAAAACTLALGGAILWSRTDDAAGATAGETTGGPPAFASALTVDDGEGRAAVPSASEAPGPAQGGRTAAAAGSAAAAGTDPRAAAVVLDAAIAGVVRVDGRAPEWPVQLRLEALDPDPAPVPPPGGAKSRRAAPRELVVTSADGGAFAFDGLPRGWRGRLVASEHPLATAVVLDVEAPRADVVLEIAPGPRVAGRIRDASGRPAGGQAGTAQLWAVDETGERRLREERFHCREDGSFRVGCAIAPELELARLVLVVEEGESGYLVHRTPPFVAAQGLELGELALEPLRSLAFTVRDVHGAPVAGAFARVDGPSFLRRAPLTGADGRGTLLLVPERAVDVRFSALGFADRVVRVAPGAEPEVVLAPLAALDVRFLGSLAADARRLRVSGAVPVFPWWGEAGWDESAGFQLDLGGVFPRDRRGPDATGGRHEVELDVRSSGLVTLVGAQSGILLTVEALDAEGRVRDAGTLSLAEGQRATLVLGREDGGGPPPRQTAKMPVREKGSR